MHNLKTPNSLGIEQTDLNMNYQKFLKDKTK